MVNSEGIVIDSEGNEIVADISYSLKSQGDDITNKIVSETNPDELDKLTQLFTLNQKKKQIVRTNKLSNLLDKVDDEVINRFEKYPQSIEDKDLIKYWSATSDIVSGRTEEDNVIPRIQINNQTNINVNSSGLDRESRARVLEVVNNILNAAKDNEVVDVEARKVDK